MRKLSKDAKIDISIDILYNYACNGDVQALEWYFSSPDSIKNRRMFAFGTEHSLIMAAMRNKQYATVQYLHSVGETVTDAERQELLRLFDDLKVVALLLNKTI